MYRIIGADGRPYGPVSGEQLRRWIVEGRANAQTQTLLEGAAAWQPLGTLPEFANCFVPPVPPAIGPLPSYNQVPRSNTFATLGLVFGILSLCFICCCYGCPFNILGIIFSLIGLSQAHRQPEIYGGEAQAVAGLILSILSLLLLVVLLVIALASGHTQVYWHANRF